MGELKNEKSQKDMSSEVVKTPYQREIVWKNAIGFFLYHVAGLYGWYLAFTEAKLESWIWTLFIGYLSGFGISIGAHRFFTHRCFQAKWPVRLALIIAHTIAGQNCLYIWVREHRQHHKYTDTHADPHNSTRGFFFSHVGWLMCRKHPDVVEKGKTTDMSDLEADPLVMFQKKYYKTLYIIFAILIPVCVPMYFFGESFRVAFWGCYVTRTCTSLNMTWLVNSAAHLYGYRPYNSKIQPVENSIVAFLSMGEGWHNYHHTFPWDYRAAELGQPFNISTKILDILASLGWVYNLKQASPAMVERWVKKFGDGTHEVYGAHGLGGMATVEVEETPEESAEIDTDAFKNIQLDYMADENKQTDNGKESFIGYSNVYNRSTVKVR